MIRRILLDIDDVCNVLFMHILKFVGCPVEDTEYDKYPVELGWNIVGAANHFLGEDTFTDESLWSQIPQELWANVPPSRQFDWLLHECADLVGKENVCLLTTPTEYPSCAAGKMEWIQKVMPKWLHRQYQIGPCKQFCAHPEALLIDDADHNVDRFREWGGQALLVPRPWNTLHATDTDYWLNKMFELFRRDLGVPLAQSV